MNNIEKNNDIKIKEDINLNDETLENLLRRLRKEKNWSYLNIVQELSKVKIMIDEKTVKKWEIGLEYPNLELIYKLSDIYNISSEEIIQAKNNSLNKGFNSIHTRLIKWICYFTGISAKILNFIMYLVIFAGLVYAFWFFMDKVNFFFQLRQ